jgi:hypothetical protein
MPLFPRSLRRLHQGNYQTAIQFCLPEVLPSRVVVVLRREDLLLASGRLRGGEEKK